MHLGCGGRFNVRAEKQRKHMRTHRHACPLYPSEKVCPDAELPGLLREYTSRTCLVTESALQRLQLRCDSITV